MNDHTGGFGSRLRAWRLSAGLSQQELAERAGLSVRTVSNMERDRTRWPYRHSLLRLADALELRGGAREELLVATGRRLGSAGELVPRFLPSAVPGFVGRDAELSALSRMLDEPGGTAVITAIGGTAGVGKTALAVHWAHQVAAEFPDGQLFVNLRGFGPSGAPVTPEDAIRTFLETLQVSPERLPRTPQAQLGLYRSLLTGKRMLIVLDNARNAAQVRPLLPGSPTCRVVVTSRNQLAGLAAIEGARPLTVGTMTGAEARQLLRERLGPDRVGADPGVVDQIIGSCANLPLALSIVAARAAQRPDLPLRKVAADLAGDLDAFADETDPAADVRTAFTWSYRQLDDEAGRVFRLAGLHPGDSLEPYAVAALAGVTAARAGQTLEALTRACMVQATGADRYGLHDLLRSYARELSLGSSAGEAGEAVRRAALTALLDHYLRTAAAAMDWLFPAEASRRPSVPPPDGPTPVSDPSSARVWLDAERANLVAAVSYAAQNGWASHAFQLASTISRYLDLYQHLSEADTAHTSVLEAARRTGDHAAEAAALSRLGLVKWQLGTYDRGADYQRQALTLYQMEGDQRGQITALHRLAMAERTLGRLADANRHTRQELAVCRRIGECFSEAKAVCMLGLIELEQGHFQASADHLAESLAMFTHAGDQLGLGLTLTKLGVIDLRFGRLGQATGRFEEAIALCGQTGNRSGESEAISQLGLVDLELGHIDEARERQLSALAIFRAIDDQGGQTDVLVRLGRVEARAGLHRQAAGHFEEALGRVRALGETVVEAGLLNRMGEFELSAGRAGHFGEARARFASALDLASRAGAQDEQARAYHGLALAHAALGENEQARLHWDSALALYRRLGVPEAESVNPL